MKKIILFLLTITLLLLTACSNNQPQSTSKSDISSVSTSQTDTSSVSISSESKSTTSKQLVFGGTYQTNFTFLSDVNTNGLKVYLSSGATQTELQKSEYDTYINYVSPSLASVLVLTKDRSLSNSYSVTLEKSVCNHEYEQTSYIEPTIKESGEREYTCKKCDDSFTTTIPALSDKCYSIKTTPSTCSTCEMTTYSNDEIGVFVVESGHKAGHTTTQGTCSKCGQAINNFTYDLSNIQILINRPAAYPRLLICQDGTWLCFFDCWDNVSAKESDNEIAYIACIKSLDKGVTWTSNYVKVSTMPHHTCCNSAPYQLENGDIICAYRALGNTKEAYLSNDEDGRYIMCSVSHDNGATWEYHSTPANGWELGFTAQRVSQVLDGNATLGVFEPYIGVINDKITITYADDLTPSLQNVRGNVGENYATQYLYTMELNEEDGSWGNRKIAINGAVEKTVSGITTISRDGMPVFTQMTDGTYVMVMEGTYRREAKNGNHPFIVLMSYSLDGENWSTPVEIHVPQGSGTKSAAPFVIATDDNRIVIGFQTDEDSYLAGTGIGDKKSIMKVMISDGTPADQIKGPENFYTPVNPFGTPAGYLAAWNSVALVDGYIYCFTGTDWPREVMLQTKMKLPEYGLGNFTEQEESDLSVKHGSLMVEQDYYVSTENQTLAITEEELYNGTITCSVSPQSNNDCGIVFRASGSGDSYWEGSGISYYVLMVNWEGNVLLGQTINGAWTTLAEVTNIKGSFSASKIYELKVQIFDELVCCYVNGDLVIQKQISNILQGTDFGIRSANSGVYFSQIDYVINDHK